MFPRQRAAKVYRRKDGTARIKRESYDTGKFGVDKKHAWYQLADEVRARDGYRCVFCKAPGRDVHHILPLSRGGTTTKSNLATVCGPCHDKRHNHMQRKKINMQF